MRLRTDKICRQISGKTGKYQPAQLMERAACFKYNNAGGKRRFNNSGKTGGHTEENHGIHMFLC